MKMTDPTQSATNTPARMIPTRRFLCRISSEGTIHDIASSVPTAYGDCAVPRGRDHCHTGRCSYSTHHVGTALAMSWVAPSLDIRQRNRRVGIILAGVFIALLVGSVIFIVMRH